MASNATAAPAGDQAAARLCSQEPASSVSCSQHPAAVAAPGAGTGAAAPVRRKRYLTIEARTDGAKKPFFKQAIIVTLPSSATIQEVIRDAAGKHGASWYATAKITSLSTGRGTVMAEDFLGEPIDALADALEEGEKWHLKATMFVAVFSQLDDKIVKDIFGYVGNAYSLQACERTCSRFKHILSDDELWQHYERKIGSDDDDDDDSIYEPIGDSNREGAFIYSVLRGVKTEQRSTGNILFPVISTILTTVLECYIYPCGGGFKFDVRGDSLGLASEIIQDHIVAKLEDAMRIVNIASKGHGAYPVLTCAELNVAEEIRHTEYRPEAEFKKEHFDFTGEDAIYVRIIRRLANRAGVVKMTDDAMKQVMVDVFNTLEYLLWIPVTVYTQLRHKQFKYETEDDIDLWHDMPPVVRLAGGTCACVIVPGQIEDSARQVGLGPKSSVLVYGQTWILSDGQTLEQATAAAQQRYMVKSEPFPDGEGSLSSTDTDVLELDVESTEEDVSVSNDEDSDEDDDCLWGRVRSDDG